MKNQIHSMFHHIHDSLQLSQLYKLSKARQFEHLNLAVYQTYCLIMQDCALNIILTSVVTFFASFSFFIACTWCNHKYHCLNRIITSLCRSKQLRGRHTPAEEVFSQIHYQTSQIPLLLTLVSQSMDPRLL